MKKVITCQDFSCYGKASLNIALPVFEAAGLSVAAIPTMVLSTQSDGFETLNVKALEEEALKNAGLLKKEGLSFDAFTVGYLAGAKDESLVRYILASLLKEDSIRLLDPVLGDEGRFYGEDRRALLPLLKDLIPSFPVITPNWTEACFLTDEKIADDVTFEDVFRSADKLLGLGAKSGVITSVSVTGSYYNVVFDENDVSFEPFERFECSFPGTGDLFASILAVRLLSGDELKEAAVYASALTAECVSFSAKLGRERREGVVLRPAIRTLSEVE
jgi:Pyridoxal/pyridoxine/pyridoxamine kinase